MQSIKYMYYDTIIYNLLTYVTKLQKNMMENTREFS